MGIVFTKGLLPILLFYGEKMMKRHKKRHEAPSGATAMLIGTLASAIITAVLSLIFSFVAYNMSNPDGVIGIFSLAALLIAGAAVGFILSRAYGRGGILIAALSSLLFSLILLLIGLIAGGGALPLPCIINYLSFIAVSTLAAFLGKKREKHRH